MTPEEVAASYDAVGAGQSEERGDADHRETDDIGEGGYGEGDDACDRQPDPDVHHTDGVPET
jgi:hypothetical protein